MRGDNTVQLLRAEKIRARQRRQINAQDLTQSFRVPVSGTAGTGVAYVRADLISFPAPFRPQQASSGSGLTPIFTYGFELEQKGDPESVNALTGFAKVVSYAKDANGYINGVVCDLGVCLMNNDEVEMDYTGFAHLQFTGAAVMTTDYTTGETN